MCPKCCIRVPRSPTAHSAVRFFVFIRLFLSRPFSFPECDFVKVFSFNAVKFVWKREYDEVAYHADSICDGDPYFTVVDYRLSQPYPRARLRTARPARNADGYWRRDKQSRRR